MKIKYFIILACFLAMFSACDDSHNTTYDVDSRVDYIPVQTEASGRWGMISTDGKLVFDNEFICPPSVAIHGLFSVDENNGCSLYSVADQPKLVGECEDMSFVGLWSDGLIPVCRPNEYISVLGADGSVRFSIEPIKGKAVVGASPMFSDGLLVVMSADSLYGCIDTKGQTVITPQYVKLLDFSEGYSIGTSPMGKNVVLDYKGATIGTIKAGYQVLSDKIMCQEFVVGDPTGQVRFMGVNGQIQRLPSKVKAVGDYNKDVLVFQDSNGFWGLMSRKNNNEVLMRPKFKTMEILDAGYLVNLDGMWSVINIQGRKLIDFGDRFIKVVPARFEGAIKYFAQDNAGWALIDAAGEEIHTPYNIYDIVYGNKTDAKQAIVVQKQETDAAAQSQSQSPSQTEQVDALVDEILDQVTPNSLCNVQLNCLAARWFKNQSPESLADTKEFTPDSVPEIKAAKDITLIGVTDRTISVAMRFNVSTNKVEYAFLPGNCITAVELDLNTNVNDVFDVTKDKLMDGLKEMGFRIIDDDADSVLMRTAYANLEISKDDDDSKKLTVLMYRL